MTLVRHIKWLARQKGMTLSDVEREAGLGSHTITRWDKVAPSYDKVVRVAQLLDVTVEQLISD